MNIPNKGSIIIGIVIDRAMIITYQFLDGNNMRIANRSSGVLRNLFDIPEITLPPRTRTVVSYHRPNVCQLNQIIIS
jgi:hypothetical protein